MTDTPHKTSDADMLKALTAAIQDCDSVMVEKLNALFAMDTQKFSGDVARALIARADKAEAALTWQPHETAPKDGTEFIACLKYGNSQEFAVMVWHDGEEDWTDTFGAIIGFPSLWMPLRKPAGETP